MTPKLTDEQRQALEHAEGTGPVSVEDPATHTTYVLVRADFYEQSRLANEDDDIDPAEVRPFVEEVMRDDDAHDPLLERYQRLASSPRS
jgi:hypothetical protein